MHEGLSREQARRQMFVMDVGGLVVEGVSAQGYQLPVSQYQETYADWSISGEVPSLLEVIEQARPTVLFGLTGVSGLSASHWSGTWRRTPSDRSSSRCPIRPRTARRSPGPDRLDQWQAIIASGSPFADTEYEGARVPSVRATTPSCFPVSVSPPSSVAVAA